METEYDIVIIGGGVIGCGIARELSRYQINILLVERENDVARGTSGKNSGVIHSGFDPPVGTLKARLNIEGNKLFKRLCQELDIPFNFIGKLVVVKDKTEIEDLKILKRRAKANGVPSAEIISSEELRQLEPNVEAQAALYLPTAGITLPYLLNIALAENALSNGVKIHLNEEVKAILRKSTGFLVKTTKGVYRTRWVINAAGLYADQVAKMVGIKEYRLYPCRGEYYILDKRFSGLVTRMIYPVPPKTSGGKGIHLTPTIEGNILVGPSAEYIRNREDVRTTLPVAKKLFREARQFVSKLPSGDVIARYAGVRCKVLPSKTPGFTDFLIEEDSQVKRFINLIGIESPGLTAAPAIARMVAEIIDRREGLRPNPTFNPRRVGIKRFDRCSLKERFQLVTEDPDYGEIICRCENVTRAELIQAIRNPLGVRTLSGLKYRARVMMGRCQGGYCLFRIVDVLKELYPEGEITLKGEGSKFFSGKTRED
ncbi:TPA: FAD/NAD(P)-binding oxidoreductase [bacterium]|nr:FAD/NAD(P)-binding oxidoreductase [bacterium]